MGWVGGEGGTGGDQQKQVTPMEHWNVGGGRGRRRKEESWEKGNFRVARHCDAAGGGPDASSGRR